jgi:hypothetical protein
VLIEVKEIQFIGGPSRTFEAVATLIKHGYSSTQPGSTPFLTMTEVIVENERPCTVANDDAQTSQPPQGPTRDTLIMEAAVKGAAVPVANGQLQPTLEP